MDPHEDDVSAINRRLTSAAELTYSAQRCEALANQIQHLSEMLAAVRRQQLGLSESPLGRAPRQERGER
jgi:hypothetical protein